MQRNSVCRESQKLTTVRLTAITFVQYKAFSCSLFYSSAGMRFSKVAIQLRYHDLCSFTHSRYVRQQPDRLRIQIAKLLQSRYLHFSDLLLNNESEKNEDEFRSPQSIKISALAITSEKTNNLNLSRSKMSIKQHTDSLSVEHGSIFGLFIVLYNSRWLHKSAQRMCIMLKLFANYVPTLIWFL